MPTSAPPLQLTLEPGTRLDRYELLCVLAHGGMANVWLARVQGKMGFERLFAVKTILPNVADDASFKTMFLDEARIASRIEHPNVVHMVDVGESNGTPYLVMDLVDGEPLHKLPRACEKLNQRIPLGVILRILSDACHGLHAAHELKDAEGQPLGVVHRDMSPQNILLSAAGVSKVIDFGVAKARDRSTGQTTVGTLKGKISFMPREQALGQEVDRRADTWALGAVLYYLLSGRPPFKGEHQLATLQQAMNGAAIPPLSNALPLSLRMAVTRSLAHEPGQRFQTALEMGEALEGLMRKLGVVTTHAEVGAFVRQTLGDRFEARRALVQSALGEAANREAARKALTVPRDTDSEESSNNSHSSGLVAVPTSVMAHPAAPSAPGSQPSMPTSNPHLMNPSLISSPGLEDSALRQPSYDPANMPSTGATFVAQAAMMPASRRLLPAIIAAAGILAVVGGILIAVSMRSSPKAGAAAAKAAESLPAVDTPLNVTLPSGPATGVPGGEPAPSAGAGASASAAASNKGAPNARPNGPGAPVAFVPPPQQPARPPTQGAPAAQPPPAGQPPAKPPPKKEDYGF